MIKKILNKIIKTKDIPPPWNTYTDHLEGLTVIMARGKHFSFEYIEIQDAETKHKFRICADEVKNRLERGETK